MAIKGRPTDYKPEYCDLALSMGSEGCSVVELAVAIGVHRDTVYGWAETIPEFSDAFSRARDACQAWWERQGRVGLTTPGFNSSLWSKNMGCRFKGDWTETSKQEISGPQGAPVAINFNPISPPKREDSAG